jgi:hypothetical protein
MHPRSLGAPPRPANVPLDPANTLRENVRNCPLLSASQSECKTKPPADVRKCPDLSGSEANGKTKPNPIPADGQKPLTPRQRTAAGLLLGGSSQCDVAMAIGVDARTVRRWLHDARFLAEIDHHLSRNAPAGRFVPPAARSSARRSETGNRRFPTSVAPQNPSRRIRNDDQEDREVEAMIARILGGA